MVRTFSTRSRRRQSRRRAAGGTQAPRRRARDESGRAAGPAAWLRHAIRSRSFSRFPRPGPRRRLHPEPPQVVARRSRPAVAGRTLDALACEPTGSTANQHESPLLASGGVEALVPVPVTGQASCQGEGRGFESRRPLHTNHQISAGFDRRLCASQPGRQRGLGTARIMSALLPTSSCYPSDLARRWIEVFAR